MIPFPVKMWITAVNRWIKVVSLPANPRHFLNECTRATVRFGCLEWDTHAASPHSIPLFEFKNLKVKKRPTFSNIQQYFRAQRPEITKHSGLTGHVWQVLKIAGEGNRTFFRKDVINKSSKYVVESWSITEQNVQQGSKRFSLPLPETVHTGRPGPLNYKPS